ncbi:MAG TPA: AI-2E family transporter, partial [Candidatus Polarisedimenticolia bacterium]|nr:AI-2E family transporter [Candidatus Polarisedimenticolia bacterium]
MAERRSPESLLWKVVLAAAVLWLLYQSFNFVMVTLIALMIAAAMMPVADLLQRRRVPRLVTVAVLYAVGLGGLVLLVALLVPVVVEQAQQLMARAPAYREQISVWVDRARAAAGTWTAGRRFELPDIGLKDVGPVLRQLGERSLSATRGIFTGTMSALIILFAAAYIVVDRDRLARGLLDFLPPRRRREAARVGAIVMERMGGYVLGQVTVSLCIAVLLSIGLSLLGLDTPILIAVTAGALNFVPFLGSTIGLLLALLVALNKSLLTVLGVLILFGAVQFVEGNILVPYLLERKVALHPLAVLAAMMVGAQVAGLIGVVVSVPILAGANAVVQELYVAPMGR